MVPAAAGGGGRVIISRTPYRVSFFGGGTDYPVWYRDHPGAVLATTINKYCYLTCRYLPPFFEHKYRIIYSKVEYINRIEEIQHPVVRAALGYLGLQEGIELHYDGDLPARTGLGSSSTFAVGLLHSLYALKGVMPGKRRLAEDATLIEQKMLAENVGSQDQVLAAHGGFLRINFSAGGVALEPMVLPSERLELFQRHLMLFFTGFVRNASEIAGAQIANTPRRTSELRRMYELVGEAQQVLIGGGDLTEFGRLLHEGWTLKRRLSELVSTSQIDEIYERARSAGAVGGKLLGAGGGGFMLLFVPPERQTQVRRALAETLYVPFEFEHSGSQIIFYDPDVEMQKLIQGNGRV
jgi:D-glycero-alpha-D-manno-heptose-7-phosphate kinase